MKSLSQLFTGFGDSVTQAIEQALSLGLSLGSSIADIAQSVEQALMQPLYRALTIAGDWLMSGFRGAISDAVAGINLGGWIWECDLNGDPCAACVVMHGTIHTMDEDMVSHLKCGCQQNFFSGQPPDDIQSGADWFDEQDDATQLDVLGSKAALAALKDGAVSLEDFLGYMDSEQYGPSRYQKSLKEILGAKGAKQYYG